MPWPFTRKSSVVLTQEPNETSTSCSTRFAFRLFRSLTRADVSTNVFFSPSSLMLSLSLVRELASGETRRAMSAVLETAGLTPAQTEAESGLLTSAFRERADAEVAFANSLWLGSHSHVLPELSAKLRARYQSELATVDFGNADTVPRINAWVNDKTRGKISRIVNQLSPLSVLVALNAVYFKGLWGKPFEREKTHDAPFTSAARQKKQLPMMIQFGRFNYYEDEQLQMAVLPYKGDVSMRIALPAAGSDWGRFAQSLNSGLWEMWSAHSEPVLGTIELPRFKVDYEASLRSALSVLGMERAFDPDRAEFAHVQTNQPPVWIDQVIHRAVAEVNEEGTVAAAVTFGTVLGASARARRPARTFTMIVNRPFFLAIRDDKTRAILFMGWIGDPQ
jgi:serine protease inhibitor